MNLVKRVSRPTYLVNRLATRTVAIYVLVAAVWILVSDRVLAAIVQDAQLRVTLSMVKGWGFVAVTATLLFLILRRETRHWTEERLARGKAEEEMRAQNERQQLLVDASRLAWEASDQEHDISAALMAIVGPHIRADFCFHYRLEDDGQHLRLIAGIGVPPGLSERLQRLKLTEAFCGKVAMTGSAVTVTGQQVAEEKERGTLARLLGVKAYTAHPLLAGDGRVLGTLSFASKTRESFSTEEIALLQIICRFASLATERVRAMAALRESEGRYRLLAENTADVIWVLDVESQRFRYMSPSIERLRGFTPAEALNQSVEEGVTPASFAVIHNALPDRLRGVAAGDPNATTQINEVELRRKDGSTVWTEIVTTLVKTPSEGMQMIGVSRDITERRKMERKLRSQETLLRETTELAHIGGWEFDPVTLEGTWTEETARIHDLDPAERTSVAKGVTFYTGPSRATIEAALREAIIHGTPYDLELELTTVLGRSKWVRTIAHPVVENGKVVRIRGTIQDVTTRRRAEAFSEGQKKVLEMIASGQPLRETLGALVRLAEAQIDGAMCTAMILDSDDVHLSVMAAPNLPEDYVSAIDGLELGQLNGSCGAAAFRREVVVVEDIEKDPLWAKNKNVALAHGLRACWSTPVLGDRREMLGTFAFYFKRPCKPEPQHHSLIELTAHAAAIAINRSKVELALHASEEQSRAVVESAPEAIFIQTKGCFAYLNPMAVSLFGVKSEQELIGRSVVGQFHPEDRTRIVERIRRINEERQSAPLMEQRLLLPNGSTLDVEVSAVPFVYNEERGALVFARDVTTRKRDEERLRFQEAILRETGHIAKVGGWSFDPVTGKGNWTEEVANIHDLPLDAPTSIDHALKLYDGQSRKLIQNAIKAAVDQGAPYDLELELTTVKGNHKWVRTIGHPVVENGKVVRVRGSFQDITERKLAEEALRESEARFRQVVENIEEVFWVTDPEKNEVLYISPAYEKIWGRSVASVLESPRSWIEAIQEDDRERVLHAATSKQVKGDYAETYRIRRPDGAIRWIQDRAFPVRDAAGRVYRVVGIASDITERRKLEAQFRQAQKMEAIGTLAGGIAHDFNNILGAILGFTELAKMDMVTPVAQTSLDEVLRACKRASDLVRQILAFSRQQEYKRQPLQLWRVVDEAIRLLRAALPATIEFKIELAKNLPAVMADATQIHQVVMNLCTNAAHAMSGRAGRLSVRLERFEADEAFVHSHPGSRLGIYAKLEVKDNGHGMDQVTLDRIYEPFFTTKAPGEGTGLGLSVVHGIIQNHDGIITVYSRPGEGTVFHVYFPAEELELTEVPQEASDLPKGNGELILVVDDEAPLAQMTGKMLEKLGYHVEVSTQPVEALHNAILQGVPYDLILTDLTMPGMTGTDFTKGVSCARPAARIVLMTGYVTKEQQEQLKTSGVREILIKPITMRNLAETVRQALKS